MDINKIPIAGYGGS